MKIIIDIFNISNISLIV